MTTELAKEIVIRELQHTLEQIKYFEGRRDAIVEVLDAFAEQERKDGNDPQS